MTPPPALASVGVAALVIIGAGAALAWSIWDYFASPVAISSTSGNRVFEVDGELVAYPPYMDGFMPTLIGVGFALLAASVVLAAVTWRPRARPKGA